jgi:GAF domain-containing protein
VRYLAVPVVLSQGETVGGLFFGHPLPGVFTARTERLMVGIAAQAAVAINNARLYRTPSASRGTASGSSTPSVPRAPASRA